MIDLSILIKIVLPAIAFAGVVLAADRPAGHASAGRSVVLARNGMVAASQPLAAQAGLRILQKGGNAVDAAVATAAALAVVEPMMTGPGGDMFALAWMSKSKKLVGLNGSGFSPQAATIDYFKNHGMKSVPASGARAVSIPGAVDGWATLLEAHGTMSLGEVLAPAIEYAEQGFPVTEIIAGDWKRYGPQHAGKAEFAKTYLKNGEPYGHGDVFVNKDLAKTLRQISEGGRDAFYKGEFAQKMVDYLNRHEWPVTMEDLAFQHSDWVEPISTTYRGVRLYELPPNGQGMAALEMLNILDGFDLKKMGYNSSAYLHHLIEAKKLAFADLGVWLADPERAKLPVDRLISKKYAEQQRRRIDPARAAQEVDTGIREAVEWLPRGGDTVYLTVVDKDRNAVSFINSIFLAWGSGMVVPGTGVILHNRGALFNLLPDHANRLEGRKRPYHTIIPAMAFKGDKPWLSFGVMGGDMQPQGHVQILLNMLEFGMNVQEAGEASRFRHNFGEGVALESGIDPTTVTELSSMGHDVVWRPGIFGGYQAIEIDWENGVLRGGTDPRKDGQVAAW